MSDRTPEDYDRIFEESMQEAEDKLAKGRAKYKKASSTNLLCYIFGHKYWFFFDRKKYKQVACNRCGFERSGANER